MSAQRGSPLITVITAKLRYNKDMLRKTSQLDSLDVASLHTGNVIDVTGEIILDPSDLSFVGFYLTEEPQNILLSQDIREVNKSQVIVDSSDVLVEPKDLLRLKEVLETRFQLLGAKVRTKSGKKLGAVNEYIIDDVSWMVQKIHVRQSLLRSFMNSTLIVDRRQVIDVTDNGLIVEDALVSSAELATHRVS